jgi:hypothetical protein
MSLTKQQMDKIFVDNLQKENLIECLKTNINKLNKIYMLNNYFYFRCKGNLFKGLN